MTQLASMRRMRCHRGHENPVGLWNCPECTDQALDLARKLVLGLEGYERVIAHLSYPPTHTDITGEIQALREALYMDESK